jgi:hypothetical protein
VVFSLGAASSFGWSIPSLLRILLNRFIEVPFLSKLNWSALFTDNLLQIAELQEKSGMPIRESKPSSYLHTFNKLSNELPTIVVQS